MLFILSFSDYQKRFSLTVLQRKLSEHCTQLLQYTKIGQSLEVLTRYLFKEISI